MTLYVVATAAGMAAAALGLSIWGLWRATVAQSAVERALRAGLTDIQTRVEEMRATPPANPAAEALAGMREDVSVMFNHLAEISSGQIDVQKAIEAAIADAVDNVVAQMAEHEKRAVNRNEVLRDDQEKMGDQLEAAIETLVRAMDEVKAALRDEIAPVLECSAALSAQIADLPAAGAAAEARPGVDADAVARAAASEAVEGQAQIMRAALKAMHAALKQELETSLAQAVRSAGSPKVFNSGRIVSLFQTGPARADVETPAAPASRVFPGAAAEPR
ncbi:MAG: hypothetical protein ACK4WC_15050 [Rubrimonas sp.]